MTTFGLCLASRSNSFLDPRSQKKKSDIQFNRDVDEGLLHPKIIHFYRGKEEILVFSYIVLNPYSSKYKDEYVVIYTATLYFNLKLLPIFSRMINEGLFLINTVPIDFCCYGHFHAAFTLYLKFKNVIVLKVKCHSSFNSDRNISFANIVVLSFSS